MLLCSVVCVTECYSSGPTVNHFIFKKQMGHARLEINYGQISDLKTIGQKLDNYYNDYQPDVEYTLFCCFSLARFYPRSILGSFGIFGMSLTLRKSSYWRSVGGSRRAQKEGVTQCDKENRRLGVGNKSTNWKGREGSIKDKSNPHPKRLAHAKQYSTK